MSKRSHPSNTADASDPFALSGASSGNASAAAAPAASSKRVKFDELVASGFGAEVYGGKAVAKSSVEGLALGSVPPEQKSVDRMGQAAVPALEEGDVLDYDDDGQARLSEGGRALTAEEEMEAILKLVDNAPEVAELDAQAVRQILQRFSKTAERNIEQRIKFATQPEKFMESEVALDECVHALQPIATSAHLYPLLLEAGAGTGESHMETICNLIVNHENLDIAADCIALLNELVDAETIGQEGEEIMPFVDYITGASSSSSSAPSAAAAAASSSSSSSPSLFLSTIVSALSRFPSEHASEQSAAIGNLLSVIENLTDLEPLRVSESLVRHTELIDWLMKRLKFDEFNANKLHASEILSIVLTNAGRVGQDQLGTKVLGGLGIKSLIRFIAKYRKADPSNSEEVEFLENLFDILCVALHVHPVNQKLFVEHDGLQLMLTMIKRATYAKNAAFKALDYAVQNNPSSCGLLIDLGGLKSVFGALMFAPQTRKDKADATAHEQHLLSIITQMFLHCEDVRYLRLMRKFQEQEMLKTERTVELLVKYQTRVDDAEARHVKEHGPLSKEEQQSVETYVRQSDHGLGHVELASIVLAFLATAGDQALRDRVEQLLNQQDIPLTNIQRTLRQYVAMMGEPESSPAAAAASAGAAAVENPIVKTKRVLEALAAMLDAN